MAADNNLETTVWSFPGGLHPPQFKDLSNTTPIVKAPLPQRVVLPLHMHIGAPAIPTVSVGDRVLRGQTIAKPEGYVSAPVHASISGHVVAIGPRPIPHPSGLEGDCIVIESDGKDEAIDASESASDFSSLDPSHLRNLVRQAGIVGLGGAAFPAAVKLNPGPAKNSGRPVDTLIINGAECEPYITCDDRLMREQAEEIVAGIRVIMHATGTTRCLIGIEDNKPEAQAAVNTVLEAQKAGHIRVVSTPTIYPEGGEKQLVKVLTGKEVPAGGLPSQVGVICQNVGTTRAIYRAVCLGEPLTSRIVTVTGRGVNTAQNLEVRIGTPIEELIAFCGGYSEHVERLIMGGPMMGFALPTDEIPVVKSTNCVLVATAGEVNTEVGDAMPCIRCGECASVCPVKLLPQQLYWHSKADEFEKTQEYNLFDCIECGCCAHVCPSHIPLVQYYRYAKSEIWQQEKDRRKSDNARQRFEFREDRIAREEAEKAARAAAKKKQLEAAKAANAGDAGATAGATSGAAAALAKAKAKAAAAKATDNKPTGVSEAKAAALAAIAKARGDDAAAGNGTDTSAALSPAQAAIAKAKAAAANKKTADSEDKSAGASAGKSAAPANSAALAAIAKAKAAAQSKAAGTASEQATEATKGDSPASATMSPAEAAIAKAKAAAAAKQADSNASASPAQSAALAAIAKAKAAQQQNSEANSQPSKSDSAAAELSPAQAAIAKAKAKAAAQKATSEAGTPATDNSKQSAALAAIAKAKAAAAANKDKGES
jgi:electron transport complex protein RnfC